MQPKDMFSLAVRLLGLVFLYHALQSLPPAIGQILASLPRSLGNGVTTTGSALNFVAGVFMVGWPLLVACWLLRGAPFIMQLAYPEARAGTKDETRIGGGAGYKVDA